MTPFIISCESTVDLPYEYICSRELPVLFYTYIVEDQIYTDDMGRDPNALTRFYSQLETGIPKTSQINITQYIDFFEPFLKESEVLHIAFGSGMTNSVSNAILAAEQLSEKYPERRIAVVDSFCSSSGYGMLVDYAADLRDAGMEFDDILGWVQDNRKHIHHQFFSTDLKYYRRSGRMSGTAATVGALLSICPIMRLNDQGKIIAYDKVRGKKAAIARTVAEMKAHALGGESYASKCFVCHSNCEAMAKETIVAIEKQFPHLRGSVRLCDIGTIIASHCGPGTVAVFFLGDERAPGTAGA